MLALLVLGGCCCGVPGADSGGGATGFGNTGQVTSDPGAVLLRRQMEPTEGAFSILVPDGWKTAGGISRVDPSAAGGPANAIEARLDFAVARDDIGSVVVRWAPHTYFADMRGTPAASMFPTGSNYMGMMVLPVMSPPTFVSDVIIPQAHPSATDLTMLEQRDLPELARLHHDLLARTLSPYLPFPIEFQYSAGLSAYEYNEGGVRYREKVLVVIEDRGEIAGGQWCNRLTMGVRAPADEYDQWEPLLALIAGSAEPNPRWVAGELEGQQTRGEIAIRTQQEVQSIERQMVEHRQQTNAEIHHDMFLTLTDQEEYVDPFDGGVVTGSNQWEHRWQNPAGDVLYTDNEAYDPNYDPRWQIQDFELSKVRPRGP